MGKNKLCQVYNLRDVGKGYEYYKRYLFSKILSIFKWENLPDSLPEEEIEKNLLRFGFCGVYKHPIYDLITTQASISGVNIYYTGTDLLFSNPIAGSHQLKIGKDCILGFNDLTSRWTWTSQIWSLVERYAKELADIDSSINISIINSRQTTTPIADNDAIAESYRQYFRKLEEGVLDVVSTRSMVEGLQLIQKPTQDTSLNTLYFAKNECLKNFYLDVGIPYGKDKKERLIQMELENNSTTDEININSMLETRQKMADEINNMFDLAVTVNINPILTDSYKVDESLPVDEETEEEGEEEDDNT